MLIFILREIARSRTGSQREFKLLGMRMSWGTRMYKDKVCS